MRNRYLYITLLTLMGFNAETYAQTMAQPPRLVVSICIDQLRDDHLNNYTPALGDEGLRRLLAEGMVFTHASNNFSPVDKASATATIATGSVPYYHGITGTEWLNRETLRPLSILYDQQFKLSPAQLAVSTLGDELKVATHGEGLVFAFAPTAECAILSAGHAADGATWINKGRWMTTDYYTPFNPWLDSFSRDYVPDTDENMSIAKAVVFCVDRTSIGRDDNPDLLCVSLTAKPDMDAYLSLDQAVAYIVNGITQRVPLNRTLFVLTGTGSNVEEEQQDDYEHFHIPTGKFYINRTAGLLNMYLSAVYGSAQYVEAYFQNQFFLNRKLIDRKNINMGDILRRAQEFLLQLSGVRNVYTSLQLSTSDSQALQSTRNGFHTERCGDLIVGVAPGWQLIDEDTHTSTISRNGNITFPIVFWGTDISEQRIEQPVSTDRIAPTVARAIRIRAPNACMANPLF